MLGGLMRWLNLTEQRTTEAPTDTSNTPALRRARMQCEDNTVDYTAYHLCAFDPICKIALFAGNNVPALLVMSGRRQVSLRVPSSVHWIGCSIFAGTSSALLLSPERLVLLDYASQGAISELVPCGSNKTLFTSLHLPQGVTWGAVGCEDGTVMYWKVMQCGTARHLVWAMLTTSTTSLCRPFLSAPADASVPQGYIFSMSSSPSNPNTFVAVVAGALGVCKWYVDENRLSRFFSLPKTLAGCGISTCTFTPGAAFVVATTFDVSAVFVWAENGKKEKDRSVALMWNVETGCRPSTPIRETNIELANLNGIHIARNMSSSGGVRSDKKSHFHLLLYSGVDVVELVINPEEKQIVQREDITSHIKARSLPPEHEGGDDPSLLSLYSVVPCIQSGYWVGEWKESDFNTLLVLCKELGPLLVQRSRSQRSVKCVTPLRDVMPKSFPWDEMLMVAPPKDLMSAIWRDTFSGSDSEDPWVSVFLCPANEETPSDDEPHGEALLGVVPYSSTQAACFLPLTNECLCVSTSAVTTLEAANGPTLSMHSAVVILDEPLPGYPHRTEFIVRVLADEISVSLCVVRFSPPQVEHILRLSREQLMPLGVNSIDSDEDSGAGIIARSAKLVDCHIKCPDGTPSMTSLGQGGMSLLLQLNNGDLLIVDVSNRNSEGSWTTATARCPSGLFPAGASVTSFDTVWVNKGPVTSGGESSFLALLCTLSNDRGLIIWDLSHMQMLAYYRDELGGGWSYDKVMACSSKPSLTMSMDAVNLVIVAPSIVAGEGEGCGGAQEVSHREGFITFRDVFGRKLCSIGVQWRGDESGGLWYGSGDSNGASWTLLSSLGSTDLCLSITISGSEMVVDSLGEYCLREAVAPGGRISTVGVEPGWPYGALRCDACGADKREAGRKQGDLEPSVSGGNTSHATFVVLWDDRRVHLSTGEQLLSEVMPSRVEVSGLKRGCSIEQVEFCSSLRVLLIMSKDVNNWRWLSVVDLDSGQRLVEHTMLYFRSEGSLRLHSLSINSGLHIYVIGISGAVGHLNISTEGADAGSSRLRYGPVRNIRHPPVPQGFRSYLQFLPPPPAAKQEQGLLKRLTTQSWEEAATLIETKVLLKEMNATARERPRSGSSAASGDAGMDPHRKQLGKDGAEGKKGSRYSELKSIAVREGVSVTEAMHIMRENQTKMYERGEKISEIESKSREMAQEAATFEALARKLSQKQKSGWF